MGQKTRGPIFLCVTGLVCVVALLATLLWTSGKTTVSAPQRAVAEQDLPLSQESRVSDDTIRSGRSEPRLSPKEFGHRVRCTQYRQMFADQLHPDELSLLCDRKPLEAVKILSFRAEAGDERARTALGLLGKIGGSCEAPPFPRDAEYVELTLTRARENGAPNETLQRAHEVLAEEQESPTEAEREACQESADEFKRLLPTLSEQLATGPRSSMDDVEIEYDRQRLAAGHTEVQLRLAEALLQKGTTDSQAEALTLLRQAAGSLPAAKTQLAECLLKGCPNPAPDPMEAKQLLADAALSGDSTALAILSGAIDLELANASLVPVSEQYAWLQFRQRLSEEGCLGTSNYLQSLNGAFTAPDLAAMSPLDSTSAEARSADLVVTQLKKTQALLECD